jgi:DNA-binding NarL/FixJ family response regulator
MGMMNRMKRSRATMGAPKDLRVTPLGWEKLMVLSFALPQHLLPAGLTAAERAVLDLLLAGESNRAIAQARGVAPSTVANQIGSLFRKLGVRSRAELARKLSQRS